MKSKLYAGMLALAAALALGACGNGDSANVSTSEPNGADRAFVAAMIPHHESAVQMAEIAQTRGERAFVRELAADIIRTQNAEIRVLRGRDQALGADGVKTTSLGVPEHMMGMENDIGMLRVTGSFDNAFMQMMIPHHEGAIAMARAELQKGGDAQLRKLAEDIISAQQREIDAMNEQLEKTGRPTKSGSEAHDMQME